MILLPMLMSNSNPPRLTPPDQEQCTTMFAPSTEMAKTHADQLRREAAAWRDRRTARERRGAQPAVSLPQQRRDS